MDFVTVRDLRAESGKVWDRVEAGEEIVLTRNGKPFAVVVPTAPAELEATLRAVRMRKFGQVVDRLRQQAAENGLRGMTVGEIDAEVAAVRKARRGRSTRRR